MAGSPNQNPEQIARDAIDAQLRAAGWAIQAKDAIAFHAGEGQAVREYTTDTGPADYVLFVDGQPVGVIEAKKETLGQNITVVEDQTADYSAAKLKWVQSTGVLLPFLYEATGVLTRFTDQRDPKPRSREVFSFHRPETLRGWLAAGRSLRARLQDLPAIDSTGLRDCQIDAITHLDASLKAAKPRALVQMATGAGKTFTAITAIYRLLKHARVRKRVLFLVDTRNLGEQAEQELMAYTAHRRQPQVHRALHRRSASPRQHVPADARSASPPSSGCIPSSRAANSTPPPRKSTPPKAAPTRPPPVPVQLRENPARVLRFHHHRRVPPQHLQPLEAGARLLRRLPRRPHRHARRPHLRLLQAKCRLRIHPRGRRRRRRERRLRDLHHRNRGHRARRQGPQGPRRETRETHPRQTLGTAGRGRPPTPPPSSTATSSIRSQIRTVIRAFRDKLPEIFPAGAFEVPKTLIFAKTDSHADDIINIVREEFGEGNAFCKKVTYRAEEDPTVDRGEDPKSVLPSSATTTTRASPSPST
jgi:type I restriction enzyme R subunit